MTHLHIEHPIEGVALVELDDPARANALSLALSEELASTMETLALDGTTRAVVITGAGNAFCAGADLTQLGDSRQEGLRAIYDGFLSVANSPLVTIAAVNGAAVGAGLNLALACDVRIAGPRARFDCRFCELGIHPGGGHTWMLERVVGPQTAVAMLLMGEVLDASEALRRGLVWDTTGADDLRQRAVELASRSASVPRDLLITTKSTLRTAAQLRTHEEAVELELVRQVDSMGTPEFAARLAAMAARIKAD